MMNTLVEFVGSLVFFTVIQSRGSTPMSIVITLLGMIYFGVALGGDSHFNPGVTVMKLMSGQVSQDKALMMIGAQVAAAYGATQLVN